MTLALGTAPTLQDLIDAPLGTVLQYNSGSTHYLKTETGWVVYDTDRPDRTNRALTFTPEVDRHRSLPVVIPEVAPTTTVQRFKQQFRTVALGQGVRNSIERSHVVEVMDGLRMLAPTELRLGMWVDLSDTETTNLVPTGSLISFGDASVLETHAVVRWHPVSYSRHWIVGGEHRGNVGVLVAVPEGTALAEWLPARDDEAERLVAFKAAAWSAGNAMKSRAGWCGVYEWTMSRINIGEHHATLFAQATAAAAGDEPAATTGEVTAGGRTFRIGHTLVAGDAAALPIGTWIDRSTNRGVPMIQKTGADEWTQGRDGMTWRNRSISIGVHQVVSFGDTAQFRVGQVVDSREMVEALPVGTWLDHSSNGRRIYRKRAANSWTNEDSGANDRHRHVDGNIAVSGFHHIVALPEVAPPTTWTHPDGWVFTVGHTLISHDEIRLLPVGTVLDFDNHRGERRYMKVAENSWSHEINEPGVGRYTDSQMSTSSHQIVSFPVEAAAPAVNIGDEVTPGAPTVALPVGTILMKDDRIVYVRDSTPMSPRSGLTRFRARPDSGGLRSTVNAGGPLTVKHVGSGSMSGLNFQVPSHDFLDRMPVGTVITNSVGSQFTRRAHGRWTVAPDSTIRNRSDAFPIGATHLQSIPTTSEEDF